MSCFPPHPRRRHALALLAGLGLAACQPAPSGGGAGEGFRGLDLTGASFGRDFRLIDVDGHERTLADYRGKFVLLYFGFVQCPDV